MGQCGRLTAHGSHFFGFPLRRVILFSSRSAQARPGRFALQTFPPAKDAKSGRLPRDRAAFSGKSLRTTRSSGAQAIELFFRGNEMAGRIFTLFPKMAAPPT